MSRNCIFLCLLWALSSFTAAYDGRVRYFMELPWCESESRENPVPLLPQSPDCGQFIIANRIYGGEQTAIDEYPWMALIEYTNHYNEKEFQCGGTLINDRYVLTAAHCLSEVPNEWLLTGVRLGEWDLDENPDCVEDKDENGKKYCAPPFLDVSVEESIAHPYYNPWSRRHVNDIALLRLSRSVSFNDFVKPICLPYTENLRTAAFEDREMVVAGWGLTEKSESELSSIKLKATIQSWEFYRCKKIYRSKRIYLRSTQMCAGGVPGIDSCGGDSGGPLMMVENIDNQPSWLLVGVISFGSKICGQACYPGVYTRTADFMDWIENNIRA